MEVAPNTAPEWVDADVDANPNPPGRQKRMALGGTALIALGIAAIVFVATAIVLLAGNKPATTYPSDTAEGAFQQYLAAWYRQDYGTAYGFFSTRIKAQTPLDEFLQQASFGYGADKQSVTLDEVTGTDPRRTLYLTVEDYYGGGSDGYQHSESVSMLLETEGWRVDEPLLGVDPYYPY